MILDLHRSSCRLRTTSLVAGLVDEGVAHEQTSLIDEGVFSNMTSSIHEGVMHEGVSTSATGPQWQ